MAKKKTPEQIMCLSVFHWKITSYLEPPLWLWLLLLLLHHRTSLLPLGGECYTLECCTLEWGVGGGHGQIPGKIGQPFPPPLVRDGVFPRRKISQTDKESPFWSLILPPQMGNKHIQKKTLSLSIPLSDISPTVTWAEKAHEEVVLPEKQKGFNEEMAMEDPTSGRRWFKGGKGEALEFVEEVKYSFQCPRAR